MHGVQRKSLKYFMESLYGRGSLESVGSKFASSPKLRTKEGEGKRQPPPRGRFDSEEKGRGRRKKSERRGFHFMPPLSVLSP